METIRQRIIASVPYSCGELFQGTLNNEPCLVSCPIENFSSAYLDRNHGRLFALGRKVKGALSKIDCSIDDYKKLRIRSDLPKGRGYGTSTADIGAALYAISIKKGIELSGEEASRIAVSIEPTDSTLLPGLALFAHKSGKFHRILGSAPALQILVVDSDGFIDSEKFNKKNWKSKLAKLAEDHQFAFNLLEQGIKNSDNASIGHAACLSAQLHQQILFNPLLAQVLKIARQIGALGVCRAHSGTILGILLESDRDDQPKLIQFCINRLPTTAKIISTRMIDGGVRISSNHGFQEENQSA